MTNTPRFTLNLAAPASADEISATATDYEGNQRSAFAVDCDGEPITFFYDLPCFVSENFKTAAADIDAYAKYRSVERDMDVARYNQFVRSDEQTQPLVDLAMLRPWSNLAEADTQTMNTMLHEVLARTVVEVHGLSTVDRGHYVAQVITRWFSDGHLSSLRFRLGHLLANYFDVLPDDATPLGIFDTLETYLVIVGWKVRSRFYLDVLHPRPCSSEGEDVDVALSTGTHLWGQAFGGVRYLPLDALERSRFYNPDGAQTSCDEASTAALLLGLRNTN